LTAPMPKDPVLGGSREVSAKCSWRSPGRLAKGDAECAGSGVSQNQCDVGDRIRSIRQQDLGSLDASLNVVLMRRNSERFLECSTEMMLAQASEPSERGERDLLAHVFLDIAGDGTHLPGGQAAAIQW